MRQWTASGWLALCGALCIVLCVVIGSIPHPANFLLSDLFWIVAGCACFVAAFVVRGGEREYRAMRIRKGRRRK